MVLKLRLDGWISLVLLFSFAGFLYGTGSYDIQVVRYPQILLCIAIALSLIAFIQSLLKQKRASEEGFNFQHYVPVALVFLMIALYAAGVMFVGFAVPTVLFLIVMMNYFGERRWLMMGVIAVLFMLILYGVFVLFLSVPLPILPADII